MVTAVTLEVRDIGAAGKEPEELVDHRAEVDPLGGHEGKPVAKIESELVVEEAEGAGSDAVRPAHALRGAPGPAGRDTVS